MPDIFYMFVCFALIFVMGAFVLFLHILDKIGKLGKAGMFGAAMVYLVERFKK